MRHFCDRVICRSIYRIPPHVRAGKGRRAFSRARRRAVTPRCVAHHKPPLVVHEPESGPQGVGHRVQHQAHHFSLLAQGAQPPAESGQGLAHLDFPAEEGLVHKRLDSMANWLKEKGDEKGEEKGDPCGVLSRKAFGAIIGRSSSNSALKEGTWLSTNTPP